MTSGFTTVDWRKDGGPLRSRALIGVASNLGVHTNTPPTDTAKAETNMWNNSRNY